VDIPDISENPALPTNGTPSAADTVVNEAPLPAAAAPLPVVNEARAEADELPVLTPSPHPPPWRPRQASLSAVLVPEFAEGGSWATVLRWHVEEGTRVSAGDLLVEIMNEMMLTFELSAPVEGVIETIFSYKDQQASPWQPLCTIRRL
jgi:biotin carboxyl carrier protein